MYLGDDRGTTGLLTLDLAWICRYLGREDGYFPWTGAFAASSGAPLWLMEIGPRYLEVTFVGGRS